MATPSIIMQNAPKMERRMRRPQHPFHLLQKPFQIAPNLIAMVLPGESLKSALINSKHVSDPVSNTLIGAHLEQHYFYVKLTDLEDRDALRNMVVDPTYDATAIDDPTDDAFLYYASGATGTGYNFVSACLDRVVDEYFRDEDEDPSDALVDGEYAAQIQNNNLTDSLRPSTEYDATDIDVDIDLDANATITASEAAKAQILWQNLVAGGLTDKSYGDYLKSYGIRPDHEELHRPERIRSLRSWTYPTRLVDPADGSPVAGWSWAMNESMDKNRFFREPGFIFGVQVVKPKIYLKNMKGTLTSFLTNGSRWLPGEVLNNVAYGLEAFALGTGPLEASTAAYTLDLRDLMLYGEQFVNMATTESGHAFVDVPALDATVTKYCSYADVQGLFAGAGYDIESDGMINLNIASHLLGDLTPDA